MSMTASRGDQRDYHRRQFLNVSVTHDRNMAELWMGNFEDCTS
jgi:hypothetical protein